MWIPDYFPSSFGGGKEKAEIKVIGIGGIGGCLLPVLARFLRFRDGVDARLMLIDGDVFESSNQDRQAFDCTGNKAEVTALRLGREYTDNIRINYTSEYVTDENAVSLIRENDIIFLAVDNHATRKLVSDRCEDLENVVLLSGGNDLTDGNVQVFIRKGGNSLTLPLTSKFHPEIRHPQDRIPQDAGCDEQVAVEPQILITNNAIAAAMLNAFYAFLEGELTYDEVFIDIITGNSRQVCRSRVEGTFENG